MHTLRTISGILLTCVVAAGAAACSSNSPSAPSAPSAPVAPSAPAGGTGSAGSGGSAASEQAIAANWTAFFSAKTPVSRRIALLQNGQQFSAIIQAQAGSSIATEASASVTKVTLTPSGRQANVNYSILLAGQPALPGQNGVAVLSATNVWQVGDSSFCNLLSLENGGSKKSLPAACQAVPAA